MNFEFLKILFVCTGNTCRSPMAESVMKKIVMSNQLNWEVDSAGLLSFNVGKHPEERCIQVLAENGLSTDHRARQITEYDFVHFDYILGMDEMNIKELCDRVANIDSNNIAEIELLGSYIGRKEDEIIPDPYFKAGLGCVRSVYYQICESCENFIEYQMRHG